MYKRDAYVWRKHVLYFLTAINESNKLRIKANKLKFHFKFPTVLKRSSCEPYGVNDYYFKKIPLRTS